LPLSPSSINWYQHKLGAEKATHVALVLCPWTSSTAGVWLRATESEISATLWLSLALDSTSVTAVDVFFSGHQSTVAKYWWQVIRL